MKKRIWLKAVALATSLMLTGCVGSDNIDSTVVSVTTTPLVLSETEVAVETEILQVFTSNDNNKTTDISNENIIANTSQENNESIVTELVNDDNEDFEPYIDSDTIKGKLNKIYSYTYQNSCDNYKATEEAISYLMKRNTICIYTYYTDYLIKKEYDDNGNVIVDEDGYFPIINDFYSSYSELKEYLYSTYKCEYVDSLLSYEENDEAFGYGGYYKTQIIEKQEKLYYYKYSPFMVGIKFIDLYDIEIVSLEENECSFLYTAKIDLESYNKKQLENNGMMISESDISYEGKAIFEDGKWKLDKMILAF